MVKCLDNEILRVIETHPTHMKAVPWNTEFEIFMVMVLQRVLWSSMRPDSQPSAFSLPFYSCRPFYILNYNQTRVVMRFWSVMGLFGFVLDSPLWGGPHAKSGRASNIIHYMPCRTPCRFVHPMISLRPSSSCVKWSETVSAFHRWEHWSRSLKLCVSAPLFLVYLVLHVIYSLYHNLCTKSIHFCIKI